MNEHLLLRRQQTRTEDVSDSEIREIKGNKGPCYIYCY